jgi:hypothetical protein
MELGLELCPQINQMQTVKDDKQPIPHDSQFGAKRAGIRPVVAFIVLHGPAFSGANPSRG